MRRFLWISGVLAVIAIVAPSLVVLGLYLGILPGLVLAAAPTVFLYALVFDRLRRRLPFRPGAAANIASLLVTIGLGCALAAPFWMAGRLAFALANTGDVISANPVPIAGDVRLERNANLLWNSAPRGGVWECDALCAALLDTPGVTSVTLSGTDRTGAALPLSTFRLVPKSETHGPGLSPRAPEEILMHLPKSTQKIDSKTTQKIDPMADIRAREAVKNALIAKWALRLASEKTLVSEPAAGQSDLVIDMQETREQGFHHIAVSRIEIRNASGTIVLRRQRVTAEPIAMPIHLLPQGPMLDRGWGIGRTFLHSGSLYETLQPIETLFVETTLARPKGIEGGVDDMRERIAAAVAQPGSPRDLGLVRPWTETLKWEQLDDAEIDLLAKVIADARVTGIERIYDGATKHVSPRLRPAIITRLRDHSTPPPWE